MIPCRKLTFFYMNTSKLSFPVYNQLFSNEHKNVSLFHTSSVVNRGFGPSKPRPLVYQKPVDWLPFQWHRRKKFNLFEESGNIIKEIPFDPSCPKPDFEMSEELRTANDAVKAKFSLGTASKAEKREVLKRDILKRVQRHPHDFDSLEVKIALKTIQVQALYEHHRDHHRKEKIINQYSFPIIIQKRNSLLNQLYKIDEARFRWLLKELQLEFTPPKLMLKTDRYCKKWDLRRLTKEHCAKVVADKKAAYHAELKKEQEAFLKEKEETLAWIAKEEKELNSIPDN